MWMSGHFSGQRQYLCFSVILRPWMLVCSRESNLQPPILLWQEVRLLSKCLSDNPGELAYMISWTSPWFQNVFYRWEMKCHATSSIASIGINNSPVVTPWIIINIKLWLLHLQSGWFNNHYNKFSHCLYLMETNLSQNIMYNLMGA